ncbi:MAG TPA: PQQ-binding-like beta-propeller repeat protein [Pirellulales bacterium]|nr:PQQ-binding-like beta-propeller repeat protein [Pirellulales bacterium]
MNHALRRLPLLVAMLLWGLLSTAPLAAGDWPQWRGPRGDSTSSEQNLPLVWNDDRGIAWKAELPGWGNSTPAIWKDALFVTAEQDGMLLLLRLEKKTGKIVWTQQVGEAPTPRAAEKRTVQKFHQLHNNASPSPTTDGEVVIAHFGNGDLAVYDFAGKQLWHRNLQELFGRYSIWWGHANSPVLFGNLVINVCMQDSLAGVSEKQASSYLVAYDKLTGKQVWKTLRMTGAEAEQGDSYTTPILHGETSPPELLVMGGNQLDAYDPATGRQLWYLPGIVGGRTITGPAIGPELVYVTEGQKGELLAVKPGGSGELAPRSIAWRYDSNTPDTCCPVLSANLLFTISDNGIAMCFDAHSGRAHWKQRLTGNYKASPVAADGRIYFLNMQGLCTVVAATDRFDKLATNQLDDQTLASPAISDGRIFLRGEHHLYCIERR